MVRITITVRARPPMWELHTPSCNSSNILFPIYGVMQCKSGCMKDHLYGIPSFNMNQFALLFTRLASLESVGKVPSARYTGMGSIHVELLSNRSTSWGGYFFPLESLIECASASHLRKSLPILTMHQTSSPPTGGCALLRNVSTTWWPLIPTECRLP